MIAFPCQPQLGYLRQEDAHRRWLPLAWQSRARRCPRSRATLCWRPERCESFHGHERNLAVEPQ